MKTEIDSLTPDEAPMRKKPAVRKSTVITDSSIKAPTKKIKPDKKKSISTETRGELVTAQKTITFNKAIIMMVIAAVISAVMTYGFTNSKSDTNSAASETTFSAVTSGKVALTESELVAAVKKLGVDVFWAGPVAGAKYTLAVPADGQAYVRYLPNGEGIDDTKPNYVVIATYTASDAFTSTQAAGNTTNGVTFINAEGAAVFYSKDTPTNVYVAYPDLNYQIEVFDPIAATALDIASKSGALRLVK